MNNYFMSGKLMHKASDHNTKLCEVEKWVFLPHSDFGRLKANPYQEHEAITAARDLMYEDKNAYHCIMLLDEYGEDGLLIEAEGFDYPRLSMFVPDAKSIFDRYQTSEPELKLHDMIKDTVEKIAELAHTDKTDFTSADMIDMDEVESLVKDANVGLIMGYVRYDVDSKSFTSDTVDLYYTEQGSIDTMPDVKGVGVFNGSEFGVYVGGGEAVFSSAIGGVQCQSLTEGDWTSWCTFDAISYPQEVQDRINELQEPTTEATTETTTGG